MEELKIGRFSIFEENDKNIDKSQTSIQRKRVICNFIKKGSRFTVVEEVVGKIHQCGRFKVAYEW